MDVCFLSMPVLKFDPARDDPGFGCDVVMLDLEDSIHVSAKAEARRRLAALDLRGIVERGQRFGVRVNSIASIDGVRDLDAVYTGCESGRLAIDYLQIPKVRSHHDLALCRSVLAGLPRAVRLFPIVEIPEGVTAVEEIAAHSDIMLFGMEDMSASMYRPNEAYLGQARGRFCVTCAREGIPAIDTKGGMNIADMAAFERACADGKDEGFTGRSVIHPNQIPVVRRVFAASAEEIDQWRRIVAAYARNESGFTIVDGQVIAPPFVAKAEKMLRLHGAVPPARGPRRSR